MIVVATMVFLQNPGAAGPPMVELELALRHGVAAMIACRAMHMHVLAAMDRERRVVTRMDILSGFFPGVVVMTRHVQVPARLVLDMDPVVVMLCGSRQRKRAQDDSGDPDQCIVHGFCPSKPWEPNDHTPGSQGTRTVDERRIATLQLQDTGAVRS
jgi:hypothetical protein